MAKSVVRVKLLASLREASGKDVLEIEASSWKEALSKARREVPALDVALNPDGSPKPGYIVFVDGIDCRLLEGGEAAKEVVILPVNHGGAAEQKLVYIGWDELEDSVRDVARKVESSGFKPHVIVGVLRGGVVPARLLADELGVDDIGVVEIKLYTGVGIRKPKPYVRQPLIIDVYDRNVLVVDDVSDTGLTLSLAIEFLKAYMPSSLKSATLYVKPWTRLYPDYYSRVVEGWIVFPWEKREIERELRKSSQKI